MLRPFLSIQRVIHGGGHPLCVLHQVFTSCARDCQQQDPA
jgi:hypothetical protein